jgi:hypothetical protein
MRIPHVGAVLTVLAGAAVAAAQLPEPDGPPQDLPLPQPIQGSPMRPEVAPPPQPTPQFLIPGEMPPPDEEGPAEGFFDELGKVFLTPRFWISGAYLHWWVSEPSLPPLITRGPTTDPVPAAIGQPGTFQIFGGPLPTDAHGGARFTAGLALNAANTIGLEGSFLFLARSAERPSPLQLGGLVVGRPYVDAVTGAESVAVVSSPNLVGGSVTGLFTNQLYGFEVNLRAGLCRTPCWYLSMLVGLRQLRLDEGLEIDEGIPVAAGVPVFGADRLLISDRFSTHDTFYGLQFGLECEYTYERLILNCRGKVALGTTHEVVNISGVTQPINTVGPAASPPPIPSGVLALPSNIGDYARDRFSAVPEVGFSVGWRIGDYLRLDVGYTLLYWGGVAHAAEQVDRVVNTSQIPSVLGPGTVIGPARPAFFFAESPFWAQGVNFSLEFRY